jgi:PAS domain S-box-containing protein
MFVAIVTVVPAILLSVFVSEFGARVIQQEVEGGFNLIARTSEAGVDQYFDRITSQAGDWSSDGVVQDYLARIIALEQLDSQQEVEGDAEDVGENNIDTATDRRQLQEDLSTYIAERKHSLAEHIVQTDILDLSGNVVASTNRSRIGKPIARERLDQWYDYERAIEAEPGETFVNQIRVDDEVDVHTHGQAETMLHVSSPLRDGGEGRVQGVLINHVDVEGLNELLRQHAKAPLRRYQGYEFVQAVLSSLELYLVRKDNQLMASASRFEEGAELSRVVDTEPVQTCVEEGLSMNGVYKDYRGIDVIGASRCPADEWYVLLIEVDLVDALAPARFFRDIVAIVAVGTSGVALLFSVWAGHLFTRRIKKVLKTVKQIERGDFDARVEVSTKDEVGQVGQGVNDMAKQLETFYGSVNEMYENLFEKSPFGIYTVDQDGIIESFNPRMVELAGVESAEDAIGRNVLQLEEYKRIGLSDKIREALASGISFETESEYENLQGEVSYRRFVGIPIHRPGHPEDVERVLIIAEDISERKTAEEELETHAEQLETRVEDRTQELRDRVEELERFKNVTVGRELKMRELKERIEELESELEETRSSDGGENNQST